MTDNKILDVEKQILSVCDGSNIKLAFFDKKGKKIESHCLPIKIVVVKGVNDCLEVPADASMIHVCFHLYDYDICDNCYCSDSDESSSTEEGTKENIK